ncbi:MAG: multiple sugar transport system permease protein [Chloroflexota bacterium]|nr:multiple sugar transport system permease protein [Chloroflexota bacterium]
MTRDPAPAGSPRPEPSESEVVVRRFLGRVGFYVFIVLVGAFFALPMVWLVLAPFDAHPTLNAALPDFTLANFGDVFKDPYALSSLGVSILLAVGTMLLVVVLSAPAAYALSRVRLPGRDLLLYLLLLFSSIVTGTAAMVPLFLLIYDLGLTDTHLGVVLVLAGGLVPAGIFILKDFVDSIPTSYEESARLFGASSFQILRDIVLPYARPGVAVIAVWVMVNVWGNFLIPFILLRTPSSQPAAVVIYNFYTEGGQADLRLISTFGLLYSIPVVVMYLFVNRRYGFRFYGGLKG